MKSHNLILMLATVFWGTCFTIQTVANDKLPPCKEGYCQKIIQDIGNDKATLQVWTEDGKVIYSNSLDLDKTAKLAHITRDNESVDISQASFSPKLLPIDCAKESCSTTILTTYATETTLESVLTLFVYHKGELLSVSATPMKALIPVELTKNQG
ncbi:hypothetical protein [Shewanella sp. GD04112]|uniref:hypothetical protein n=1 Tax=Shewanella sp. GD04112 TaxID=2975434 RepID=UPI00244A791C|nr:hypothetical protein [Shewanella sp. GD04112]MDH0450270.1 hypothetical protein [Shewanella sp. GD04112]